MAKFKINASLITPLTTYGFIDGSGNTTVTFASRTDGVTKLYKLTFAAASDIIETTNDRMIKATETMPPPIVQKDGQWIIANPGTIKMFESVPDVDPNPTLDPEADGVEQITKQEKNLVVRYVNASGAGPEPAGRDKTILGPWVTKARNYFKNLRP